MLQSFPIQDNQRSVEGMAQQMPKLAMVVPLVRTDVSNWIIGSLRKLFRPHRYTPKNPPSTRGSRNPLHYFCKLEKIYLPISSASSNGQLSTLLNPVRIVLHKPSNNHVIFHELCHLIEHNHSRKFFDLLTKIYPDWKRWRDHLNENIEVRLV